jgi:DNA-binding MarR family transcriptional regulator
MNYHSKGSRFATLMRSGMVAGNGQQAKDLARIIRARRSRQHYFPPHLFADPAWDILLALALANLEQQRLSVSELCKAADAPHSTALRYIQALMDEGMVVGLPDPLDGRRKFLSLSPEAASQMSQYLNAQHLAELKAA